MHFRALVAAVPLALLMAFLSFLLPLMPAAAVPVEYLANGDFAHGFAPDGIPLGWRRFQQGRGASVHWGVELFPALAGGGAARPFCSLSTLGREGVGGGQRVGLCQEVRVVPGLAYRFALEGFLRCQASEGAGPGCGHAVQWTLVPKDASGAPPEDAWRTVPLIPAGADWRVEVAQNVVPTEGEAGLCVALMRTGVQGAGWARLRLDRVSLVGPGAGE